MAIQVVIRLSTLKLWQLVQGLIRLSALILHCKLVQAVIRLSALIIQCKLVQVEIRLYRLWNYGNPGSDPALDSEIMAIQVVIRLSTLKLWQLVQALIRLSALILHFKLVQAVIRLSALIIQCKLVQVEIRLYRLWNYGSESRHWSGSKLWYYTVNYSRQWSSSRLYSQNTIYHCGGRFPVLHSLCCWNYMLSLEWTTSTTPPPSSLRIPRKWLKK